MSKLAGEDQDRNQPDQQAVQEDQMQNQRVGENIHEQHMHDRQNPQRQDELGELEESKI